MNMNNTTKMTTIDTAIVSYLNDYHDVNRLFYKGSLFNPHNKSYYGYRLDVLKSALQKYLRRKGREVFLLEVRCVILVKIKSAINRYCNDSRQRSCCL